jgi:hypothetical protein
LPERETCRAFGNFVVRARVSKGDVCHEYRAGKNDGGGSSINIEEIKARLAKAEGQSETLDLGTRRILV